MPDRAEGEFRATMVQQAPERVEKGRIGKIAVVFLARADQERESAPSGGLHQGPDESALADARLTGDEEQRARPFAGRAEQCGATCQSGVTTDDDWTKRGR